MEKNVEYILYGIIISFLLVITVIFSFAEDMPIKSKETIKLSKAEITAINSSNLIFSYDEGTRIITVTGTVEEAEIKVLAENEFPITIMPSLLVRENLSCSEPEYISVLNCKDKEKKCKEELVPNIYRCFKEAEGYEKNNKIFNKLNKKDSYYVFNVEHFTDYRVNSTGGFETLSACLKYINNSANTCVIGKSGHYDMKRWDINSSQPYFNRSSLLLAFDFDTDNGQNKQLDTSGHQSNGTVSGGATWNSTSYYGGGFELDGVDDIITIVNKTSVSLINSDFTISLWMKPDQSTVDSVNYPIIIGKGGFDWTLGMNGGVMDIWTDNANNLIGTETIVAGRWYYVALTLNGTEGKIYLNGRIDTNSTLAQVTADTGNVVIGNSAGYDYFNGSIDQIRVYNRTLSKVEIEQQYAGDTAKYNLSNTAMMIFASNVSVDCNGSEFYGNSVPSTIGLYAPHYGNGSANRCNFDSFQSNYYIQACSWSGTTCIDITPFAVGNYTSKNAWQYDYFSVGNFTIDNATYTNNSIYFVSIYSSVIKDIIINNTENKYGILIESTASDTNITDSNISTVGNYGLSGLSGASIFNSYIKSATSTAIMNFQTVKNNTIIDSSLGISVSNMLSSMTNNTIRNTTGSAIYYNIDFASGTMEIRNNTIINAGNASRDTEFRTSLSPVTHGGTDYDDAVYYVTSAGAIGDTVTADEQAVTTPDGANDFFLCVGNSVAIGGDVTAYVDTAIGISCSDIFISIGGTQSCTQSNFMVHDTATSNYTVAALAGCDGIVAGYTDPTYLRFRNDSIQFTFPIEINTEDNSANISGNTIEINDGRENYYSMNITADATLAYNANVWLNSFYSSKANYSGNVYFCINNKGNFYEEDLTPSGGDCGQTNFTVLTNYTKLGSGKNSTIMLNWTNQSSYKSINYSFFFVNSSGRNFINSTLDTYYNWTLPRIPYNNYTLQIVPNDGSYNATNANLTLTLWSCTDCFVNSSGGDFSELSDCYDNINSTINYTCVLNEPNRIYNFIRDNSRYNVSGGWYLATAMNITANNTVIDCNDSAIVEGSPSKINVGYGIWINRGSNVTIKNCNISGYNYDIFGYGLNRNITMNNINSTCSDEVVHFDSNSRNISISNMTINHLIGDSCIYGINLGIIDGIITNVKMYEINFGLIGNGIKNTTIQNISFIDSVTADIRLSGASTFNTIRYNNFSGNSDCILFQNIAGSTGSFNNITQNDFNCNLDALNFTRTGQKNNSVWLNNFYTGRTHTNDTNNTFCVNSEGNFYEEHLAPQAGDCGQISVSSPTGNYNSPSIIPITWTKQSSTKAVNYSILYSSDLSAWTFINATTSLQHIWDMQYVPYGSYFVTVIPYDSYKNGTWGNSTNFIINKITNVIGSPTEAGAVPSVPPTAELPEYIFYIEPFPAKISSLTTDTLTVTIFSKDRNCSFMDIENPEIEVYKGAEMVMNISSSREQKGVYTAKLPVNLLQGRYSIVASAKANETELKDSRDMVVSDIPYIVDDNGQKDTNKLVILFLGFLSAMIYIGLTGYGILLLTKGKTPVLFIILMIVLFFVIFGVINLALVRVVKPDYSQACSIEQLGYPEERGVKDYLPIIFSDGKLAIVNLIVSIAVMLIWIFLLSLIAYNIREKNIAIRKM